MKTAVMTDSNSGITAAEGKELGVFIVPMPVIIDGVTYFEGKNLLQPDFFESLMSGKDVSTSQPSPGDLMELWNRVLALGYDDMRAQRFWQKNMTIVCMWWIITGFRFPS